MKLTVFSRILIIAMVLGGIYYLIRMNPQVLEKAAQRTESQTAPAEESTSGHAPAPPSEPAGSTKNQTEADERPVFSYTAPEPVNGKLRGVVELGAAGFNSFVINMDEQKRWKLEKAEFGSSLVHENMATDDDIRSGLKNYIRQMLDFGVNGRDIHFVVSSGAKNEPSVVRIGKNLKTLGYFVNEVTAQQEGTYGLQCVMPQVLESESFMVDMGSGNTKVSWMSNGRIYAEETYGSKYFQKSTPDQQVYDDVRKTLSKVPEPNRKYCFIIGGVPFELAKQVRDGKERYTVLKKPSGYKPSGEKQRAGINIYKAVFDETACRTFVFDWDANFTIGFLLNLR